MKNLELDDFEKNLKHAATRVQAAGTPAGLDHRILQAADTLPGADAPPAESGKWVPLLLAVAAVIFMLVGVGILLRNVRKSENPGDDLVSPVNESYETKSMFLFVEACEIDSSRFALLQEMEGFKILRKQKGDLIQNYTILDILDDGLEVAGDDGHNEYLSRDDLQCQLDKALVNELAQLGKHLKEGSLSTSGLDRIGQWASYGTENAIHMLEVISNNNAHPLQARADDLLFGGRQAQMLKKLLNNLEADKDSYRLSAIRGLSKIDSPHSRLALRRIAFGKEANLRIAAIRGLGRLKDTTCLEELADLINDSDTDSGIRKVAKDVYGILTGDGTGKN
ncbi:HEAT repeat domain-containing protein [Planctomycetota bacterium]